MGTWSVSCGSCEHTWKLTGNWSVYEREAVESRPCPCCGSYTLQSPEPKAAVRRFPGRKPLLTEVRPSFAG